MTANDRLTRTKMSEAKGMYKGDTKVDVHRSREKRHNPIIFNETCSLQQKRKAENCDSLSQILVISLS